MELNTLSRILLDWWVTEGNYAAYRGGKNHGGKTKDSHWADLALKITEADAAREKNFKSSFLNMCFWLQPSC